MRVFDLQSAVKMVGKVREIYELALFCISRFILLWDPISEIQTRVTRWAEFSPIGRLLTLDSFQKVQDTQTCGLLSPPKKIHFNFDKNGLGYILGDFFSQTNLVALIQTHFLRLLYSQNRTEMPRWRKKSIFYAFHSNPNAPNQGN
jgi:hypothetical protein